MYYLAAFYKPITAPATYSQVNGVVDQAITIGANNGYLLPQKMRVKGAHLLSANGIAGQVSAPSLRNYALPEVYPLTAGATVPDSVPVIQYGQNGVQINANEEVALNISLGSTGATDCFGALFLADKDSPAPGGPQVTIPFTSTIVQLKGGWVLGTMTPGTTLPAGQYAVVGMSCIGTSVYLARIVFPGFSQYRPGVIAQPTYGYTPRDQYWRGGRAGLYGTFFNTALPQLEVFGLAAGSQSITTYLDLVKVG